MYKVLGGNTLSVYFFIELALILIGTKLLGYITKNLHMTNVVGALVAGLILGPSLLGLISQSEFIIKTSELGVVILMFSAGLETDLYELKSAGLASLFIALLGVLFPLILGFILCNYMFNLDLMQSLFVGVVLTSTSVSITAETLKELGKIKTKAATAIMGACIIDDILGIILLSIITSLKDNTVNIKAMSIRIILFLIFSLLSIKLLSRFFNFLCRKIYHKNRMPIYALIFCLLLSFISERYFKIASIIGAYLAGTIISINSEAFAVKRKLGVLSYLLLSPIFFASIGIKTHFDGLVGGLLIFTLLLLLIAILTKILGCGLASKLCGYSLKDSIIIGVGMVSRGEVALIITNLGVSLGLLSETLFSPVVLVVIVTTLLTPMLLSLIYKT